MKFNDDIEYRTDEHGTIHQVTPPVPFPCDSYSRYYRDLGLSTRSMSALRLGWLFTVLGRDWRRVLDVGYGSGEFLALANQCGLQTYGYDVATPPPPPGVLRLQDLFEVTSWSGDVITFFDSLEHIPDLEFVAHVQARHLAISLPWCHWPRESDGFRDWKHRKPHEHLHHFSRESLERFMKSSGWEMIFCEPWEDAIRRPTGRGRVGESASRRVGGDLPNILSAVFRRTESFNRG